MPIEIRELVIKATIHSSNNNPLVGTSDPVSEYQQTQDYQQLKEEIIQECLDRVEVLLDRERGR